MRPIEQTITVNGPSTGPWWPLELYTPHQVTPNSVPLVSGSAKYTLTLNKYVHPP